MDMQGLGTEWLDIELACARYAPYVICAGAICVYERSRALKNTYETFSDLVRARIGRNGLAGLVGWWDLLTSREPQGILLTNSVRAIVFRKHKYMS